jgi:DNA polymerase-1
MEAYKEDPELDPHEMARQMVAEITGHEFERKDIKITAFSIIYGSGVRSLAEQLGRSQYEATLIKDGYLKAMPGVKKLQKLVTTRANQGMDIRTWGGRMYYKEPSKVINGRKMNFAYKLLNYLIQGSSADQTKQCLIDWDDTKPENNVFLATVHDELNISAPVETWEKDMAHLKECMEQDLFDVPMLSEGFVGDNWYNVQECD